MKTNKEVAKYLDDCGYHGVNGIVFDLIEGGYIKADLTEPERYAKAAKDWIGTVEEPTAAAVFKFASGWNTASWETVLDESFNSNIDKIQNVFWALVLLAKEAGIKL